MSSIRIGVISDTHGLLRNQAKQALQECELIIHAGDVDNPSVLAELEQIAPTTVVKGNMDWEPWANHLKPMERLQVNGWMITILHNIGDLPALTKDDTDIVIFGHSHKFLEEIRDGILFLNPGSAGPRRFTLPISMAILRLGQEAVVEQVILSNKA